MARLPEGSLAGPPRRAFLRAGGQRLPAARMASGKSEELVLRFESRRRSAGGMAFERAHRGAVTSLRCDWA